MPEYDGYDVQLSSTKLKLIRDPSGAPQLRFRDAPDEPGQRGGVGTIAFDKLYHGIGPAMTLDTDRYPANGAVVVSAMRPERVECIGGNTGNLLVGGVADQGTGEYTANAARIFSTSIQQGGDVYFILPQKVIKFAAGATSGSVVTVSGIGGSDYIRGPGAFYRGKWWFGLEDNTGKSIGHVEYDIAAGTWTAKKAGSDSVGSLFFSVHTLMWKMEMVTAGPGRQVTWRVKTSDAQDISVESAFVDSVTTEKSDPYPTAIYPLGRWLLIFGSKGEIVALSENPPMKALVPAGMLAVQDDAFGVGARLWGDRVLVPSSTGLLLSLSLSGALQDLSPVTVQAGIGEYAIRPTAVAPFGTDVIVGTQAVGNLVSLLGLREYPDGLAFNSFESTLGGITGTFRTYAMESLASGRTYILYGNGTSTMVRHVDLPPPGGGRPVSVKTGALVTSRTSGKGLPFAFAASKKIFLQMRTFIENNLFNMSVRLDLMTDDFVWTAMTAAGSSQGPLVGSLARPAGRYVQARVTFIVTSDDGVSWPVVLGPVFVDYMEEPAAGTRVECEVEARGGIVRAGSGSTERVALYDLLKAMQNTNVTLAFLEGTYSKTVYVEQVEMQDTHPALGRERPQAAISLVLRVL